MLSMNSPSPSRWSPANSSGGRVLDPEFRTKRCQPDRADSVQDIADLRGEGVRCERLLEKRRSGVEHALMNDGMSALRPWKSPRGRGFTHRSDGLAPDSLAQERRNCSAVVR